MKEELPPEEEGDIVIKGTYTTKSGAEVPVEIHTNKRGLIYQRWREELAARRGGEVRELREGEVYEIGSGSGRTIRKPKYFQKQPQSLDIPDTKGRTLIEVFAEEKAQELAKIQLRLDELRGQLRLSNANADPIRAEILSLEKQLLGDP